MWVSMVLTLTPNRDCTPVKNRSIPTIPAGRTDIGPAHVSAVDTGPRRNESPWGLRHGPAPPSQVRAHRPLPVACGWGPVVMVGRRLRCESRLGAAY